MNLDLETNRDYLAIALRPESPLSHIAFGLEMGVLWFMGRGVFSLEFVRTKNGDKIEFITRPLTPQKPLLWSNFVRLSALAKQKEFPIGLFSLWSPQNGETIIETSHIHDQTIGELAWGISDVVADLFMRGAVKVRVQHSQNRSQILFDKILTDQERRELFNIDTPDYKDSDTAADLCWP